MKKLLGLTAIGVLALGAAAIAGEKGDMDAHIDEMFAAADTDKSGAVSETEFVDFHAAKARKHFAEMAGDDASLTSDEVKAFYAAKHEGHGNKKDGGDGQ